MQSMKRKSKTIMRIAFGAFCVFLLAFLTFLALDSFFEYYINSRYSYLNVKSTTTSLYHQEVKLHDVTIQKDNAFIYAKEVTVSLKTKKIKFDNAFMIGNLDLPKEKSAPSAAAHNDSRLSKYDIESHFSTIIINGNIKGVIGNVAMFNTSIHKNVSFFHLTSMETYGFIANEKMAAFLNGENLNGEYNKESERLLLIVTGGRIKVADYDNHKIDYKQCKLDISGNPISIGTRNGTGAAAAVIGCEAVLVQNIIRNEEYLFNAWRFDLNDTFKHGISFTLNNIKIRHSGIYQNDVVLGDVDNKSKINVTINTLNKNLVVSYNDVGIDFKLSIAAAAAAAIDNSKRTIFTNLAGLTIAPVDNQAVDCQKFVNLIPLEITKDNPLSKFKYKGTLNFAIALDEKKPKLTLQSTCGISCDNDIIKSLKSVFTYQAYHKDGQTRFERQTGPKHLKWVSIENVSMDMTDALISMEDPGFKSHRGVIAKALENSLQINLKEDRIIRGGSTITMQLVKNLWLSRHKTIFRKLQEVFLAYAIESCLTKDEIVELYLNVVEFGPDVYGIGEGANYYFDKHPLALNTVESFYLASILPNPNKAEKPVSSDRLMRIQKMIDNLFNKSGLSNMETNNGFVDNGDDTFN